MLYREIKKNGDEISVLGFGAMRLHLSLVNNNGRQIEKGENKHE